MACCKHEKNDLYTCIPFYAIGLMLAVVGIPLMVVGIAGTFRYADLLGYVGGIAVFFGILFLFLWHMFTIPSMERSNFWDTDRDDEDKGATVQSVAEARQQGKIPGFANLGYDRDDPLPGYDDRPMTRKDSTASSSDFLHTPISSAHANNNSREDIVGIYDNPAFGAEKGMSTVSGSRAGHVVT